MSGTFVSVYGILIHIISNIDTIIYTPCETDVRKKFLFFVIPFVAISAVYAIIYVCCYYPGLLSLDSIDQVSQTFTGKYSNHQPFYHTLIIGLFIRCGLAVFGDINSAVATYVVFQMLFMAATFAFVIYNMALLNVPTRICSVTCVWYCIMPFHIMYSFTVWKDVYFGAFVTLMIVFFIIESF